MPAPAQIEAAATPGAKCHRPISRGNSPRPATKNPNLPTAMPLTNSAYCGSPQYADYVECAIMHSDSADVALWRAFQ